MLSRRRVLGVVAGSIAVSGAWGLRGFVGAPDVDGTEPTVSPGEETSVTVEATNVGAIHFSSLPEATVLAGDTTGATMWFDFTEATLSPSPGMGADTEPPYWYWRVPRGTVTVDVPVSVDRTIEPGEYRYEVTVWNRSDRSDSASETGTFAITVTEA